MAPGRRRGAGKVAATRRQWKVGDLVLAKVKGFPAWPATVSEPEKWGYQADWKKVLVYFFGTQQIAFCNPADVEAFTEEKKQSLLTKRQVKGADFARALQEIIESYENSQKSDQIIDQNSGEDVTLGSDQDLKDTLPDIESKDPTDISQTVVAVDNDRNLVCSIAADVANVDTLQDKEALAVQPLSDAAVTAKCGITTYTSRKRSGGLRSRKYASLITDSAVDVDVSRSLSKLDSGGLKSFMVSSNDGNKSCGDATDEIIFERSLRRNKRMRRSLNVSEWHDDVNASALISNGSNGDHGSEIVTIDSDNLSLNDNSTEDSAFELEPCETGVECLEGDAVLNKGLDFQGKAVVIKKKRKPNRKRSTSEAVELFATQETGRELEAAVQNSVQNLQDAGEDSNKRHKENGDEHLPLVKRARVRMGKLSNLEEGNSSLSQEVERTCDDVTLNPAAVCGRTSESIQITAVDHVGPSISFNVSADFNKSDDVKGSLGIASPQKVCTQIPGNRSHNLMTKECQPFGSSADAEAALPPSKRLHRALEAMSAYAAEQGDTFTETSCMRTLISDCSISSLSCSLDDLTDGKETDGPQENIVRSVTHRPLDNCSSDRVSETVVESPLDAGVCNQPAENAKSQEQKQVAMGNCHCKDPSESCSGGLSVCTGAEQSSDNLAPTFDKKLSSPQSHLGSMDQLSHIDNKVNLEDIALKDVGAEIADKNVTTMVRSLKYSRLILQTSEALEDASQNGSTMHRFNARHTEPSMCPIDKNQTNSMLEESKETEYDHRQQDASYVPLSSDKDVLVTMSNPIPVDGIESPVRMSPTMTSRLVSTAESDNFIQNSGGSSPNYSQEKTTVFATVDEEKTGSAAPQRPKSVGKLSTYAEANAALSSFEGVLGSLTRTKESIGRATRIAIDCAKLGVSSKVLEILAHHLESEPSMNKRVDLFFLVDSITQRSRGSKGDVGGAYSSSIQSMLPRLLKAAAPAGNFAQENRRQCLKVLRLWLDRRIFPETLIRRHMRELDQLGSSAAAGPYSRRSSRTERALDDPVRDMEGMLVDEYGSNSSLQLPGFCMPRMLKDKGGGSDSDGESFEAVTPEHDYGTREEQENTSATGKHTRILEDVDGELEMEDVAPSCEVEGSSTVNNLPPPLPPAPHSRIHESYMNNVDSKLYTNLHNMHDDSRESVANPSISSGMHHASEYRERMPARPANNSQHLDNPNFHQKPYPPRPPQTAHSNHFSYVQTGHHIKPWRETSAPSYPHRYHSYNGDGRMFHGDHERMRSAPYEPRDGWRYHSRNFHGPPYPDKARGYHPSGTYGGLSREPSRIHHQEWPLHQRGMYKRNFMSYRPYPEYAFPVSDRAWQPR